ncbi:MAG TPA: glycosyltransferase family 4 protein [Vicinamibacterales bacterium]
MRIVFLNPSGELGGAETALLDLLAALREARPAWALSLVASAPGPLIDHTSRLGIHSVALPFPSSLARLGEWGRRGSVLARVQLALAATGAALPVLSYASALRRHLAAIDPDIVHTNGLKMHLLGARCRPTRTKVLWHLHDYPDARPLTAALLRASAGRCAGVIANSASVAEQTRRLLGSNVTVRTVHNAVDLERFNPHGPRLDLDALSRLPALAPGGLRIGLVGTFARGKGHDVFLRALSRVRSDVPIRAYVIGGPIYETHGSQFSEAELRGLAASAGVGDTVGFTGRVEDVPAALRALDIVVHASVEPEPFGLVIAEAMACGRPLVVSRAGGAAEIAQAGALFHDPGDADGLADRLSQLAVDAPLRAELGVAGREAATRLFARSHLASALIPVYESL